MIDTPDFKGIDSYDKLYPETFFGDIYELAALCQFKDYKHDKEPNCAV